MKRYIKSFFFLLLIVCFSCEDTTCYTCDENGWLLKCSDCSLEEPVSANLNIKLTDTESNVHLIVYEGELEDRVIYRSVEVVGPIYNLPVPLNKKYTVTAEYLIKGITYISVDDLTPKVKYVEDQCDEPCYFVYDRKIDLRLKYTAD